MGTRRFGTANGTRRTVVALIVAAVGVGGAVVAGPAFAESPAAAAAHTEPLVPGTPCSVSAKSCVDLESQQAWLIQDGKVIRGPVRIASGGNGQETPVGHSLRVYRKDQNHLSQESRLPNGNPAPMPWSVFFEDGGIAFHSGSPDRSSGGCIHLEPADAEAWFNYLQIGDMVQVVKASEEMAARGMAPPPA
ncbi:L,D-transpeptidase [Pseudonocardia sp. WMMC193]|uniref:L,D-transpeptidase n=1 Tax=Pseudonocardia sp. WMMC193 TaxID=2911965 RepID=UPI001F16E695|nr:L,D-transpeptidase [Pseudonocardia sp. WMMC193]MCF7551917.1 L,D-transpeptidase [Pseudonocardia sp. WMMC193]